MSKELILFLSFAVGDLTEKADALGLVFGEEVVLYSQLEIQRSNVHLKAGFMSIRKRNTNSLLLLSIGQRNMNYLLLYNLENMSMMQLWSG
jgi:hypothetical protein